ncbi:C-x8-C-x5-C-x3-H type zinc finger protein [Penicillium brasilianum]|uniref:C-x8-C-x5-C-x3-H type zinc finger protein n=1 Tax=Penicillium brasilianum TaxID=104259 RepID=A0A0F7TS46_PENBI|nr:C-x8-C-x5-C-x3-H type zinc finger protein [Penicillium brasilianum]CEJ58255.1 Putative CCCH zinc finger protein [Penicillium brasilianum]
MTSTPYLERYRQLGTLEQQKNQLIEDLLQRVTDLETSFAQEKLDHERETRFNRDIQLHEMELMQQISQIKTIMDREPFVVVLLDGEGIIFKDEFLQGGEDGGRNAADQLYAAIHSYLKSYLPSVTTPKIMMKIYLNAKGFGEQCARNGILPDSGAIHDFIRGFNETMSCSEIVDVGSGKNSAHNKIQETFQVFLYNCHCHQIFVGCPSNTEYALFLEDVSKDNDLTGRVSLVEGVTFERELDAVKSSYRIAKFPDVFRSAKMAPAWAAAPWKSTLPTRSVLTPSPSRQFSNLSNPPALSRTSTNTSASGVALSVSTPNPIDNPPDFQQVVRPKPTGSTAPKTVERNKYGQRVDRLDFKSIPRDDLNRLKKLKLCNYHFLLGECPNEEYCYHDHDRKLTKQELHILTAIARMTPCRFGLECDDPECIYGHRCPQSEPGKKTCFRGDSCRFEPVAHGIDTNIVKVTKI